MLLEHSTPHMAERPQPHLGYRQPFGAEIFMLPGSTTQLHVPIILSDMNFLVSSPMIMLVLLFGRSSIDRSIR